jgi:hypothetical protein
MHWTTLTGIVLVRRLPNPLPREKLSDVRTEQRQRRRPDRPRQCFDRLHAVQAADVADGSVAIAVRLFDGVAQLAEVIIP